MTQQAAHCPYCRQLWVPASNADTWRFPAHYIGGEQCPGSGEHPEPESPQEDPMDRRIRSVLRYGVRMIEGPNTDLSLWEEHRRGVWINGATGAVATFSYSTEASLVGGPISASPPSAEIVEPWHGKAASS